MRAIDLFAGFGGFTLAARRAGLSVVWAANHWKTAVEVHSANHPETKHSCQDLRQADWTRLPRYDVLLASPACVPAEALLERGDGTRTRADAIRLGDEVLTHEGRRRPITNIWRKAFSGDMVSLDVWGTTRLPVEMTSDHLVWIRRRGGHAGKLGAPRFVLAGEVRPGDYVGFPRVAGDDAAAQRFVPQPHAQSRTKFDLDPARVWRSVRSVVRRPVRDLPVFDFEVGEDHTFCLPGVIVHNCQGHSTASQPKRRAYHDEARSTAWAVIDCADATNPETIIIENVPAFRRWRLYPHWSRLLVALGYHVQELLVMASHHGVPQRRERLFIVAARRGPPAIVLPRGREPAFRPCLDPGAGGWRPITEAKPGAQQRIAKGRRNYGHTFLTQHVTGHPGVPLDEPIRTITTAPHHWALVRGGEYRYLTDRELARGMGFPDSFTWPADLPHEAVIEGLGNAVCPAVGEAVIRAAIGVQQVPMLAAA